MDSKRPSEQAINATQAWVDKVVVGLNFCPFAKREVSRQSIRYCCLNQAKIQTVLAQLKQECQLLDSTTDIETTLLILSKGFDDFFTYLNLFDKAEQKMAQWGYTGIYQLASFHPLYVFDDESYDSAANYTNRSPYPMLHLLREDSLSRAIDSHKSAEQIPLDNIKKARQLGTDYLAALLRNC